MAEAIQRGDATGYWSIRRGAPELHWIAGTRPFGRHASDPVRALAVECGRAGGRRGSSPATPKSIAALGGFRLLCAHRRGPEGVATWTHHIENWLLAEVADFAIGNWYVGRPLIVTENDHGLQIFNGDIGVVVTGGDRPGAAFERGGEVTVSPTRLAAVDTVYAMTVHKSQGSQYGAVAFLVPTLDSRILTRELLYTAVTRAQERLILVGPEELDPGRHRAADHPASGLRRALWGEDAVPDTGRRSRP